MDNDLQVPEESTNGRQASQAAIVDLLDECTSGMWPDVSGAKETLGKLNVAEEDAGEDEVW